MQSSSQIVTANKITLGILQAGVMVQHITPLLVLLSSLRLRRVNTSLFRLVQTRRTCIDVPHTAAWGAAPASD